MLNSVDVFACVLRSHVRRLNPVFKTFSVLRLAQFACNLRKRSRASAASNLSDVHPPISKNIKFTLSQCRVLTPPVTLSLSNCLQCSRAKRIIPKDIKHARIDSPFEHFNPDIKLRRCPELLCVVF